MSHASVNLFLLLASPFVGSFIALFTARLPLGEPVVFARSHCRSCGTRLGPLDLLPVVSALALQGRCRHCHAPFGYRDGMIEGLSVLLTLWAVLALPPGGQVAGALLGWCLLTLAVTDWEGLFLPDLVVLPLGLLGLVVSGSAQPALLPWHLGAAFGAAGLLWALRALHQQLRGREGLGLGDVKFFGAIGAWVGLSGLGSVLLIAAATALVVYAVHFRRRAATGAEVQIPFGTFLAIGCWLTWVHGPLGFG